MSDKSVLKKIREHRLAVQQVSSQDFKSPASLLSHLGAIQAQDYEQSLLALNARLKNVTREGIEKEIEKGKIARSWIFRGTLQLAASEDLDWMLDLVAERVLRMITARFKNLGLDSGIINKALKQFEKMKVNECLGRDEIAKLLEGVNVKAEGLRLTHIIQYASYKKLLAYGPKRGKELTHIRLSDPLHRQRDASELGAKLASIYLRSRGPATAEDFAWWSGLTLSEAKKSFASLGKEISSLSFEGKDYRFYEDEGLPSIAEYYLLPGFDEYFLAYRDRSLITAPEHLPKVQSLNGIFKPIILKEGLICGIWKKQTKGKNLLIELQGFNKKIAAGSLKMEVEKLRDFYQAEVMVKA